MIINTSVCIEASKSETWKYLSDLEGASAWVEDLVSTKLDDPESRGVGTIRICEMKNGKKARERITDWLEGSAFTYNVIEAPMMKAATNSWAIEAVDGKSLVTSKAVIQFKGSFLGASAYFAPLHCYIGRCIGVSCSVTPLHRWMNRRILLR